ncbi:UNVERIFIED_CONTAM: Katanin p80 WD40 repeat-containing subunit B1 [Sesamum calycinum]|uniref:Katanin p80 WD40 repeat-containing subunit B1 n=1 Tax=Sesamum calycinum TaxID=2727403 RepID=A0AAW2QYS7_9LAMI
MKTVRGNTMNMDTSHVEGQKGGIATLSSECFIERMEQLGLLVYVCYFYKHYEHELILVDKIRPNPFNASNFEHRGRNSYRPGLASSNVSGKLTARSYPLSDENESVSASDEDTIADLMELHDQFVSSMKSRLNKLQEKQLGFRKRVILFCRYSSWLRVFYANQHAIFFIGLVGMGTNLVVVVLNYWQRHDIKGAISAISKMGDHSVVADVMSLLAERIDMVTLDICSCLLPLLSGLIESDMDRHQDIALEVLLKLVRLFGSVIYSSLSAPSSVGVDIEAEQRLERCNLCYVELEKVKGCLPILSRRGGSIAKSAHELNLALQEVS